MITDVSVHEDTKESEESHTWCDCICYDLPVAPFMVVVVPGGPEPDHVSLMLMGEAGVKVRAHTALTASLAGTLDTDMITELEQQH